MFKDIKELRNHIENESENIALQHQECDYCGGSLIDNCGYEEYIRLEEYAPDKRFCSEHCLEQYLLEFIGVEECGE